MKMKNYIILIIAAFIQTGSCLKCFQCNSAEYPECADILANDTTSRFLKKCDGDYEGNKPFCRKFVTNVMEDQETRILRSCGWILEKNNLRKDSCKKEDSDFIKKTNCVCFSDMCNASSYLMTNNWIFSACLILLSLIVIR